MHTGIKAPREGTPPAWHATPSSALRAKQTGGYGGLDPAAHRPALLVTVAYRPDNWASNMAAGSQFGYALLWVVTLSTIMLIVLQHNAAHLGIVTGTCLAEAARKHLPRPAALLVLPTWQPSPPPWPRSWARPSRSRCSLACPCARAASL